ncbi:MAG: hypothetical protein J6P43_01370 [Succinivibrionaceae bacterium]|nr:hypothetical protein [Succinivibrionaceae bacterium]
MKICLKKILLAGAAAVLLASQSFAWTIRINGNGMNYEGAQRGNELVYRSKGKIIGASRVLGGEIEYRDGKGKIVGFAKKSGNEWVFRDDRGKIIGTAVKLGKELIYKNTNSSILGTAVVFGSTTEYRSSNNAPIGKADTDIMPLRPIPLERAVYGSAPAKPAPKPAPKPSSRNPSRHDPHHLKDHFPLRQPGLFDLYSDPHRR